MSKLFLLNEAINTTDFSRFKEGIKELIAIEKKPNHTFYKHESIYNLPIFENDIYPNLSGQEEQEIFRFIEQTSPYQHHCYINTEEEANSYCNSHFNGFLGFINIPTINSKKQVTDNTKYREWCFTYSDDKEYLLTKTTILPNNKKFHLSDHHGKKELSDFWDKIKKSLYIESARSTRFGSDGKIFIREIYDNGEIEIVLNNTNREYALLAQTTGKDILETTAIADILKLEFGKS